MPASLENRFTKKNTVSHHQMLVEFCGFVNQYFDELTFMSISKLESIRYFYDGG